MDQTTHYKIYPGNHPSTITVVISASGDVSSYVLSNDLPGGEKKMVIVSYVYVPATGMYTFESITPPDEIFDLGMKDRVLNELRYTPGDMLDIILH